MTSIITSDNSIVFSPKPISKIHNQFEPGVYQAFDNTQFVKITTWDINLARPTRLESTNQVNRVLGVVDEFFDLDLKQRTNACGFLHQRNILVHGRNRGGIIAIYEHIMAKAVAEHQAICFLVESTNNLYSAMKLAKKIRAIQGYPIVIMMVQLEIAVRNQIIGLQSILNGERSVDNMMFLAATEHMVKIPDAILLDRANFDLIMEYNS